jgi:AcrR family transcriptional regulator
MEAQLDADIRSPRQRILDAMIETCASNTYAATTIGDIVARARISRTTFYKHFTDKRTCFDAAVGRCFKELEGVASAAHEPSDAPSDAARQAATAILLHLSERPHVAQLLSGDAISVDRSLVESWRGAVVPALEGLWSDGGPNPETHADPRIAFAQAQLLIFKEIVAGRSGRLDGLLPEIVYLAVVPFGGHEQAVAQSRLAVEIGEGGDAHR